MCEYCDIHGTGVITLTASDLLVALHLMDPVKEQIPMKKVFNDINNNNLSVANHLFICLYCFTRTDFGCYSILFYATTDLYPRCFGGMFLLWF